MTPDTEKTYEWCIVFGQGAGTELTNENNVLLIGDGVQASRDNDVVVGETLWGQAVPDDVRQFIEKNPDTFRWVVRTMIPVLQQVQVE